MKKSKFPQSFRFQHNGSSLACTTGVKYVEKLDGYFFLHWESLWPGVMAGLLVFIILLFQRIVTSRAFHHPSIFNIYKKYLNYFKYLFLSGEVVFEKNSNHVKRHCTVLRVFNFCPLKFSANLSNRKVKSGYKFMSENT